jgi:protocadherin alpha
LAGIVTPNDGECHLDGEGYYTKSMDQDYPSIALLHQKIKDNKVNMIFAVTNSNQKLYQQVRFQIYRLAAFFSLLFNI